MRINLLSLRYQSKLDLDLRIAKIETQFRTLDPQGLQKGGQSSKKENKETQKSNGNINKSSNKTSKITGRDQAIKSSVYILGNI